MTESKPAKREALGKGIEGLLGGDRAGRYTPVVKSLEALGIEPRVMAVAITGSDEPVDCLVIPAQELLIKEYAKMSGVDPNLLLGKNNNE